MRRDCNPTPKLMNLHDVASTWPRAAPPFSPCSERNLSRPQNSAAFRPHESDIAYLAFELRVSPTRSHAEPPRPSGLAARRPTREERIHAHDSFLHCRSAARP